MEKDKRYFIVKPSKTRKVYSLACYSTSDDGKRTYHELPEQIQRQVVSINARFKSGPIEASEAVTLLKDIISKQYRKNDVRDMVLKNSRLSAINQKLFNQYWEDEYSARILDDEKSARYDILKAIRLADPLSLQTATAAQLQAALKKNTTSRNEHRRAADRLNQLLRYLNRGFKLDKPAKARKTPEHLAKDELMLALPHFEDVVSKDLAITLFCSGLRLSEAMALTPADFLKDTIFVDKQVVKSKEEKDPKKGKKGHVATFDWGKDSIKRWTEVENKERYREKFYWDLREACQTAFPKDKSKWVGPHDLRHSHAIHLFRLVRTWGKLRSICEMATALLRNTTLAIPTPRAHSNV